jgi:colanic acid/amylovoran biosynthesis protein
MEKETAGMRTDISVLILGAPLNTRNMGVNALAVGTVTSVISRFGNARISLLDYSKDSITYKLKLNDIEINVPLINIRFSKKFYLRNNIAYLLLLVLLIKYIPFRNVRRKFIIRNSYLDCIDKADVISAISGGDSFSDIYGMQRFIYVFLPQLLVLILGKKLVLLPQTLGPFNRPITKLLAQYIMKRATLVYSRDYDGLNEARRFLGTDGDKIRFCYDVGFLVDPIKPDTLDLTGLETKHDLDCSIVGVNISGLLYMGGYTRGNMFGLRIDYRAFMHDLIDYFITKKNAIVLLVPHVYGDEGSQESDYAVCEEVYIQMKEKYQNQIFLARGKYDQSEIKYIIGKCDFFIGSRMHACIAALSQNIPTVPIAYSKKFQGVMETIGVEKHVADPRTMSAPEIMNMISALYDDRDVVRRHLENKMPEVRRRISDLFDEIWAAVSG